jgi:hypothetical protein
MSVQLGAERGAAWDRLDIAVWALIFHHATVHPPDVPDKSPLSLRSGVVSLERSWEVCSPRAFVNLLLVCRAWKVRLTFSTVVCRRHLTQCSGRCAAPDVRQYVHPVFPSIVAAQSRG